MNKCGGVNVGISMDEITSRLDCQFQTEGKVRVMGDTEEAAATASLETQPTYRITGNPTSHLWNPPQTLRAALKALPPSKHCRPAGTAGACPTPNTLSSPSYPPASRTHLVHIERCPDSVACTMAVIEAFAPQGRACECVECTARGTLGEHSLIQSDMALGEGIK